MAKMIPPQVPVDCRSPGEKILFSRFKDDPDTANWIVLHSLGIARHSRRIAGEIDFVVLVPGEGLLCLEVKSGYVARHDGIWTYGSGSSAESSAVGPFRQASEGMHAIRNYVSGRDSVLRKLLFVSGVVFTFIDFNEESVEWHSWQWADRSAVARQPISAVCLRMLRRAHDHVRSTASAAWYDAKSSRPSREHILKIAELLKPDFEFFVSPQTRSDRLEERIKAFTEEQFGALDVLADNKRIIYKGPAGTGKTFLAIESAGRLVQSGQRTLLACYNRLLGDWLVHQTESLNQKQRSLTVGTFHSVLLRLSGLTPSDNEGSDFWTKRLPERVLERALTGEFEVPLFDAMILDEAQDLIAEIYLDIFEMLLHGGLAGGRWVLFGDFERQAIYTEVTIRRSEDLLENIKRRAPHFTIYPLRTNCRNVEDIAIGLELICRLQPGYSRILNTEPRADVVVQFYRDPEDQTDKLRASLVAAGHQFSPAQIIVLSAREDRASCAARLSQKDGSGMLDPLRGRNTHSVGIPFATIHAFKGLESPAVILTDIDDFGNDRMEALLYVGMSRARQRLWVLMHESCRIGYEKAVREGFRRASGRRGEHVQP